MAYLNVRERRIEAKIAYVGPELSGKATNLDQLKQGANDSRIESVESSDGELVSLAWADTGRFRDCSVRVSVVAQRGAVSEEQFRDVMREADGVIVVVDAHPDSQARNLASLTTVRDVLARADSPRTPIVVQVNKNDLPNAVSADDVASTLEGTHIRHVTASAMQGEGVVETLETVLDQVFDAMNADAALEESAPVTVKPGLSRAPGAAAPVADGGEGHPLLTALKQVLRDTVREHVAELETRLASRLEVSLGRIETRIGEVEAHVISLQGDIAISSASKDDVAVVSSRLDRVRDDMKGEIVRTIETRARAEREHLATATTGIKRAIDTISADVKDARNIDVGAQVAVQIAAQRAAVASQIAEVVELVNNLSPRLEHVELSVRQRGARVEDAMLSLRGDTTQRLGATDEKIDAVHGRVNEIVEELKKTKKGWFT